MIFVVIGVLLIAGGYGLSRMRQRSDDNLLEVRSTKRQPASELESLAREIREQIGPGGFSQLAEVRGRAVATEPLRSELAQKPCVWYRARVEEEYEETVTEESADGSRRTSTRRATETISDTTRSISFEIEDESGRISVDPKGAKIDGEVVMERQEPFRGSHDEISFGGITFHPTKGRTILGHRYREEAIPVGAEVYVIGDACDRVDDTLCIREPNEASRPFIVSTRSEKEIVDNLQKQSTMKKWGSIVLLTLGVLAILFGLTKIVG